MTRTLLTLLTLAGVFAAPPLLAQGQQAPPAASAAKPGAAGCSGPVIDLIPGVQLCDLDPGKTVRILCGNGKVFDVVAVNGNAQAPPCQ